MKLLLDEDVPMPLVPLLRRLLQDHEVEHVNDVGWRGKADVRIYPDAAKRGFDAILTNDMSQFNDPGECDAIKRSHLHHITYELDEGLDGLALACAAICASIRDVLVELSTADTQRIVRLQGVARGHKRHSISDPSIDPPSPYW